MRSASSRNPWLLAVICCWSRCEVQRLRRLDILPDSSEGGRWSVLLFASAIFGSAFLIFLVQPMVGKRILPWFGGAPAVWTLCLAFYQTTLFAGYAYAHCLIRYAGSARQLVIHGIAFAGALLALPVLPGEAWKPGAAVEPNTAILAMLVVHVALPFLVLAATGPLVQAWFARGHPNRSPYPLYAVSNVGSLLALLSYPFFLEPRLPLSTTERMWSLSFVVTAAAVLACAALAWRHDANEASPLQPGGDSRPLGPARIVLWLLLAGCAVVLLMGVTNELCLDVASVPFLWILPLGVYLTSFIICFGSERAYRRGPYVVVAAAPFIAQSILRRWGPDGAGGILAVVGSIQLQVVVHCLLLFGTCMVLHGELYRLRPPARSLTAFYLCVSGGGALGGLFVGIAAPRIFEDYYELQFGLALAWLLLLAACWHDSRGWLHRAAPRWRWAVAASLSAILLVQWGSQAFARPENVLHQERTFFGVLRVLQIYTGANEQRQLYNGTTLHGVQFPTSEQRPTIVFGVQTGIGLALAQREPNVPMAIGVVGLGIGTLAAYGRPRDRFRFYEIDPAVIRLARNDAYFTYLARSRAEIEIVEGDGRISLASERARNAAARFDLLVIDAFTSVAIPVHLLTREAIQLYVDSLKETGLLAVHISNRHFDLMPLLARLGDGAGLRVVGIETTRMSRYLSSQSSWVFLSRDEERLRSLERFAANRRGQFGLAPDAITVRRPPPDAWMKAPLWTDDYSDLFGSLRPFPVRLRIARNGE
jgi:spermidine synthase